MITLDIDRARDDYKHVRVKIVQLKKELQAIQEDQVGVQRELSSIDERYQKEVRDAKAKGRDAFNTSMTQEYEDRIHTLEEQLAKLECDLKESLEQYDDSHVSEMYTNEKEMLDEVNNSVAVLNEKVIDVLGERFQKELNSQLDSKDIDLTDMNLDDVIAYFNNESAALDRMTVNSNLNVLDKISDGLYNVGSFFDANNGQMMLAYIAFMSLILFFASKLVFPILVVLMTVLGVYNILRSYRLYSAMVSCKIVKDNIDRIDKKLRDEALVELQSLRDGAQESYNNKRLRIENEIEECKESISRALQKAGNLYYFDDTKISRDFDTLRRNVEEKKIRNERRKREVEMSLREYTEKYDALTRQIGDIHKNIIDSYLSPDTVGESYTLRDQILVDIDPKGKPVLQDLPHDSCLFLYDDLDEAINLMKLICFQLRNYTKPQNLAITMYDDTYLGREFLAFTSKDFPNIFNIIVNSNDMKTKIASLASVILERTTNIIREFSNIDEYNKFMLSQDSLTATYEIFILLNPDTQILSNPEFCQLLVNGGALGLITYIFFDSRTFHDGGESSRSLVDNVSATRLIQNGVLYNKARDYIKEKLIKA